MCKTQNKNISTLFSYDTVYTADSVEWCPHEPFQNVFVCANYQLAEQADGDQPCKRLGRILLFSVSTNKGLELKQEIQTDAVLDQKWCHSKLDSFSVLGVVDAKNKLNIYKLLSNVQLELVTSFEFEVACGSELLILSLDWSTGKYDSAEPEITCSDSKGNVHLLTLYSNELTLQKTWNSHAYEAWISAFYYWDTNIMFSGGDDCLFFKYDKRIDSPIFKNRTHEAGVTSVHSNKKKEYIFATGSYDQNLRLWDIRNMKNAQNTINLPGPLWRVKWDPFDYSFILCACMLGGVHIVDTKPTKELQIVGSYYGHKNIAYGADWSYLSKQIVMGFEKSGDVIIGTCSFYDHLLCISKCNLNLENQ